MPQYKVGEEDVIFLSGESDVGLTAPIGIWQGKFDVKTSSTGEKLVVNGTGNRGLLRGGRQKSALKAMVQTKSGEFSYKDFVSLIKQISE